MRRVTRLLHDVRLTLRGLRRSLTFTISATLILGVGIGMAVAMVAVYDAVLLRKLPVRDQDGVAILWPYRNPGVEYPFFTTDLPRFREIFGDSRTMQNVAGFAHYGAYPTAISDGDVPLILSQSRVTGNFFD